ncbi:hypothetical protein F3I16_19785 [Pseudomonas sp. L-22-4S-12]|uniref:tetratricopeptide repeat protein n=1 Tax=Pseudomonas sp. L-22-4S-12 TaxID=2610893 RepID=UPI001321FA78|nr:sel1 repeat family protein [Pseudomonas sp. L-22-4S-12]MWV18286.1 hypothetical protein [Pseudomonas sp. L-22-4S-12]
MIRSIALVSILALILGCKPSVEEGVVLHKQGNHAAAVPILAAHPSDGRALYYLSNSYRFGLGVDKDGQQSAALMKRSAANGYIPAIKEAASNYLRGRSGFEKNPEEAARLYRLAIEKGEVDANIGLGDYYEEVGSKTLQKEFYLKAENIPEGQYSLAKLYEQDSIETNNEALKKIYAMIAFKYAKLSVAKQETPLFSRHAFLLSQYYYYGFGVDSDISGALQALRPVVERSYGKRADWPENDVYSLYAWILFWHGDQEDKAIAVRMWSSVLKGNQKLVHDGLLYAKYGLAIAYDYGWGIEQNKEAARLQLKKHTDISHNHQIGGKTNSSFLYVQLNAEGHLDGQCIDKTNTQFSNYHSHDGFSVLLGRAAFYALAHCNEERRKYYSAYFYADKALELGKTEAAMTKARLYGKLSNREKDEAAYQESLRASVKTLSSAALQVIDAKDRLRTLELRQ